MTNPQSSQLRASYASSRRSLLGRFPLRSCDLVKMWLLTLAVLLLASREHTGCPYAILSVACRQQLHDLVPTIRSSLSSIHLHTSNDKHMTTACNVCLSEVEVMTNRHTPTDSNSRARRPDSSIPFSSSSHHHHRDRLCFLRTFLRSCKFSLAHRCSGGDWDCLLDGGAGLRAVDSPRVLRTASSVAQTYELKATQRTQAAPRLRRVRSMRCAESDIGLQTLGSSGELVSGILGLRSRR